MRILFDTNVILDVLLRREPFFRDSALLLNAVEAQRLVGLVGATTCTIIHYLVARHAGANAARESVQQLLRLFEIAPIGRMVLEDAAALRFADYEDAVHHEAARHVLADGIVTRNVRDYRTASLLVYSPLELLQLL